MKREIRKYGDPVLREKSHAIAHVDAGIRALATDMIETMKSAEGVGLAAQQIGETRAICVIGLPPDLDQNEAGERLHPHLEMPMVLINPHVTETSKQTGVHEEGCLSFPNIRANITRPVEITIKFTGLDGKNRTEKLRDFAARAVQHEVDHLNGILFIDKMSPAKKFALKRKISTLRAETEEELGITR